MCAQCDTFIEEYGEKIIQALVDGYGPKIICTLIGVCLGEESRTTFTFNMKSGGVECEVCETALEFVKEILGESFVKVCVYQCCLLFTLFTFYVVLFVFTRYVVIIIG